jgi:large repetitive protein
VFRALRSSSEKPVSTFLKGIAMVFLSDALVVCTLCALFSCFTSLSRSAVVRWATLMLAVCGYAAVPAAWSQTAQFSYAIQTLGGGFYEPVGVAVDGGGNVYVADYGNGAVKEMPAGCTSSSCATTVDGGFTNPLGVAVDGEGNVYVGDGHSSAVKEMPAGCTSSSCVTTLGGGFSNPIGVAVDGSGNVYVADSLNSAVKEMPAGCTSSSCVSTLGGGITDPIGVAVDGRGNVYVTDAYNFTVKEIPSGCTSSSCVTALGGGFSGPWGVAVDGSGNVYVADNGDNAIKEIPVGCTSSSCVTMLGTGFANPQGIAVDASGNVYVGDTYNDAVKKVMTRGVALASTVVGQTSEGPALTFTFDTSGSIGAPIVLTQAATGLDFADAGTGTCTTNGASHSYNTGDTCTVNVTFSPKVAGLRSGAVELKSAAGTVIATAFVYGTGTGPQVAFNPGAIASAGGGFDGATGIALDGSGNVYVADYFNDAVKKMPSGCTSSSCVTTLLTVPLPFALAMDGSGNIYVTDGRPYSVVQEIPSGCTSSSCATTLNGGFNDPSGVAVDGSGNVYVADTGNNAIKEMPVGCTSSSCVQTLGGGFNGPNAVAVDGSGNVYVVDSGTNLVKEIPSRCTSSSCVAALGGGFSGPLAVSVDASGNVYVTDYSVANGMVKELPPGCTSPSCVTTLVENLYYPTGVTLDGSGNIYIGDDADMSRLDRANPSLSFAATPVGTTSSDSPQSVTVQNIGNATLTMNGLSVAANFAQVDGSGSPEDCSASTSLAAGAECNLSISFTPELAGSISGSVLLTDNNLNASNAAAMQTISLSGTGIRITLSPVAGPLPNSTYGQAYGEIFTASGGTSPYTYTGTGLPSGLTLSSSGTLSGAPGAPGSYTLVITATDANGVSGSQNYTLTVTSGTPAITWTNPAAITYGTALSATQLDATANVAGSFTYMPAAGTVLSAGSQTLKVTFTPSDSTDYQSATGSVMLTVNKASQSITFGSIAGQVMGNTLNLSATATSGLAVSFASSNPSTCSVSGTTATMLSAGTCTIQALQAGNANYAAASPVSVSFVVTPAAGFTLVATPNSETIHRGILAAFLLEAQSVNGFSGNVKITCSGGPSDSVCGDFPQTLKLQPNKPALAISGILFPKDTAPGTYTLTFTGTSGSTSATTTAQFTVEE